MLKKNLALLVMVLLFVSCAAPVQKSFLNLNYQVQETQAEASDAKLALVKPKYSKTQNMSKQAQAINQSSPFAAIMNKRMEAMTPVDYRINQKFNSEITLGLENSMFSDVESIVKSKGFRIISSAINEDEITYSQKQNIDLIIVPEFDISPLLSVTKAQQCSYMPVVGQSCSPEEGVITLSGKMYLNFIEPMSREKMLIKTVDISSLSNSGLLAQASYVGYDEAEQALIDILNRAYPELMTRVAIVIDSDEINATMADVNKLKAKNN